MLRVTGRQSFGALLAPLARALRYALLSSLLFSATAGVVHSHGASNVRRDSAQSSGLNTAGPADRDDSSTRDPLQSKDCSICQLHRNLSGGLTYGPVFIPAPTERHAPASVAPVAYLSAATTPCRGRAPPQTSL